MTSRLAYLVLFSALGLALGCQQPANPSPPPPPPPPPNSPPMAVAGGPYSSTDGGVSFDGSASSDPDGDALTFSWTFGDGGTSSEMKPAHTYGQNGAYDVSLIVTDSKGAKSPSSSTTADVSISHAVVFMGAGNIGDCASQNDNRTAALIGQVPEAAVFTLGDNAFENGTDSDYVNCYGPSWGQLKGRTHPTLGNHDYNMGNADGAFDYYGTAAGSRGKGYYSYDVGAWHVIVLNDNLPYVTFQPGSDQATWLAGDLAANPKRCTIAMWHVPLFQSSNTQGGLTNSERKPLWQALYAAGVEIVLAAQPHHYERMKPMNPDGNVDESNGIREFIVGTGGGQGTLLPTVAVHPNSEVRGATFGVLKLTLQDSSYDWTFVPVPGASFADSGSGTCH